MTEQRSKIVAAFAVALVASGCAKKESKPVHSEPWLAHPPASAAASPNAAVPATRYVLSSRSVIFFELPTRRGKVQGKLTKLSGELDMVFGGLAQSRGQVRAELGSLSLDDDSAESATWLARARSALGVALADGGSASATTLASYEVTALSDVSPELLEAGRANDAGVAPARRARATADGNLLLNGFRVTKRAALEAEFGFSGNLALPTSVVIRTRSPLVLSLETHEIHLHEPAANGANRRRNPTPAAPHNVRISVELYGTKE